MSDTDKLALLARIAEALDRLAPPPRATIDLKQADAFVWDAEGADLKPVAKVNAVPLDLLKGIDLVRDILHGNTSRFAHGLSANNALLWGARGMGKSSLVKAAHAKANAETGGLHLIEIHREEGFMFFLIPAVFLLSGALAIGDRRRRYDLEQAQEART